MQSLAGTKILYVITKSNWGGAGYYVYTLATEAKKAGAEVAVALGGTGTEGAGTGLLETRLHEAGVRTIVVGSFMRDISLTRDAQALYELIRLFRLERPDIVHLNSSKAGGLGACAARCARIPRIIFTAHGWPFWEQRSRSARALMYVFSWLTALLSHTVIVVSDYDKRVVERMPGVARKTVRIYNGIDLTLPIGSGADIRRAFPAGVHITGTIGELTRNKNQKELIERAYTEPDLYLAIVGEGELRPELESLIRAYHLQDRVKLFGFLSASDVLKGFDSFVLPSVKEGLPYVLIEARAAGLPIEAHRVGGVGEILDAPDLERFSLPTMLRQTFALYLS